ncbi:B71 [Murid betaherpesvirus 8]|uniref:Tegument protein UL51 homolog n=2 Tax=Rat cytomegalovirus (isolate England) TaxID=1261657 RepID=K7XXY4_RCMVE|nr:E71 [Murid betaherpesvirus 8]AKE44238.1 a71 [Rat cytomegalovirus ALL-03]AFX83385.1 E71 [Murid betaherpesvirus 8]AKB93265.1 B71 [Murid betaherpesvirus 8]WEG71857.1 tegument protein UL51 [Murid betaherpesvirus 8]WPH24980.1 B71 [Murid betaherpesvirus 8]
MAESDIGSSPSCFRRFIDFALCRRKIRDGSEYIVLRSAEDVDVVELEAFLKDNFENLGITPTDLSEIDREAEVTRHLLRLLPVYKRCVRRYTKLDRLLSNDCRPHLRAAAETECQKSKKVIQALDVVILKLLVGEFSLSDEDSIEKLLEKFSVDQNTLCEVGKIERLIDMDRESSQRLMDKIEPETETSEQAMDPFLRELENAPSVPDTVPGCEDGIENIGKRIGKRDAADGDERKIRITTV